MLLGPFTEYDSFSHFGSKGLHMSRSPLHRSRLDIDRLEDRSVPAAHAIYSVTENWGSGFQGQVELTNDGTAAVAFSNLQFSLSANITSIWDANMVSHTGNHYTVTNSGWDASIPAGGSVSFGFIATAVGATAAGSTTANGFVLDGVALNGGATSPPASPPVSPPVPPPVASVQATYATTSDWGSGLNGDITLKNTGATAASNWQVSFNFPGQISSIWNGTIVSHVGNRYTVSAASWNSTIPAGGSADIGFGATPGGVSASDLVVTVGGTTLSPPPVAPPVPPVNHAPTAVNDSAVTTAGQAVQISVLANDTDPDGDPLSVTSAGPAAHGSVVVNTNGTVTYTPAAGFTGTDTFTYAISDGRGGTSQATVSVQVNPAPVSPPIAPAWPAHVVAPYVDATAWPTYDFVSAAKATGDKFFTLAFITADPSGQPAWGGYSTYETAGTTFSTQLQSQITALRALGGDVAVSFGGASGLELAQVITNVNSLAAAYWSVIQTYNLTHIDFDIEGAAVADKASIDRRSQAIAIVEKEAAAAGINLNVRFTLPVLPTGLDANGLYVLQSAKQYGARVDVVNIMAMDYGDNAAPNPAGQMGTYAIEAATSLYGQLTTLYGSSTTATQRWAMIGVTPMIGLNDLTTETFTVADAQQLEAWAAQHGIGLLSMWSLNRDQQSPAGALSYVDTNSSSLIQSQYEFVDTFAPFVG